MFEPESSPQKQARGLREELGARDATEGARNLAVEERITCSVRAAAEEGREAQRGLEERVALLQELVARGEREAARLR